MYVCDRPVMGPNQYFGRASIIRALTQGPKLHRSYCLCGGPATGRSSTLLHARQQTHLSWTRKIQTPKIVPVLFDLESTDANPIASVNALWTAIVEAIRDPRISRGTAPKKMPELNPRRRNADPWALLFKALQELWEQLIGTPGWCEYTLLLDGGDTLMQREHSETMSALAMLIREEEPWAPVSVTIASGRLFREHLMDSNAPLGMLRPLFLGALNESEARALIQVGLPELEHDLIEQLLRASGRHPYVLQRFLFEIAQNGLGAGLQGIVTSSGQELLQFFERLWQSFDLGRGVTYRGAYAAPEHAMMQLLIDQGSGCTLKQAERELGIKPLKEYAEFLEYTGLAERVFLNDFKQLRPQFDLWNTWYSERILS